MSTPIHFAVNIVFVLLDTSSNHPLKRSYKSLIPFVIMLYISASELIITYSTTEYIPSCYAIIL